MVLVWRSYHQRVDKEEKEKEMELEMETEKVDRGEREC